MRSITFLLLVVVGATICRAQYLGPWEPAGGLTGWSGIRAIITYEGSVVAFSSNGRVFRSDDNCDTWQRISDGPATDVLVVLRAGPMLYAGTRQGLYRTPDYGITWEPTGLTGMNVWTLATEGSALYAGIGGSKILRSTDRGATWIQVLNDDGTRFSSVTSIIAKGAFVFVTRYRGEAWSSLDSGMTWHPVSLTGRQDSIGSVALWNNVLWAGTSKGWVITSNDSGRTWQQVPARPSLEPVDRILVDGNGVFAGTRNDAFRSTDGGRTWIQLDAAIAHLTAITSYRSGVLLGGTDGVLMYVDPAGQYEWVNVCFGEVGVGADLLAARKNMLVALGGAYGLFRSTNNGTSWKVLRRFSDDDPRIGHALVATRGALFIANNNMLFRTRDDGASWTRMNVLPETGRVHIVAAGDLLIAAQGNSIYRSMNEGDTWERVQYADPQAGVTALAARGTTIMVGTRDHGTYRSTDNGGAWGRAREHGPEGGVSALAINDRGMFIAVDSGRIFRSTDNGTTWPMLNEWNFSRVNMFTVTPTAIVAHGQYQGYVVGYSEDNGDTWMTVGAGGQTNLITDSAYIYATNGDQVVRRPLRTLAVPGNDDGSSHQGRALRVTPNPVRSEAVVRFTVQGRMQYSLVLTDMLGRECMNLGSGTAEAGELQVPLNIESLAAGTYYLHLKTATGLYTAPVIVAQ